ncbi:endolytic transglycosylase MltG [Demequina lutea]|uniref:Endolytic murein transglycosylase n=1 Tax=Demequina lutea TaxID=431489 RepID=A0A7Y9ZDI5_9MICO|nr:endolytic transglycosylase MltG [Demequina lutea]NYI41351.1 UPF0755 protein [Demequina lutea]
MTDLFEAEVTTTTSLDLRRLQRQQRRANRRKWLLVFVSVGLVLVAIAGSIAKNYWDTTFVSNTTVAQDYTTAGQGTVQVIINPGDTGAMIATTLYNQGVTASREAFLEAAAKNPDSAGIKPGYYLLQREMKADYALAALLDPTNKELRTITIPEGHTVDYYYQKIVDVTGKDLATVKAAAKDTAALGLPPEANGNLEGWLFPSTYEFNPGVTPAQALSTMIAETIKQLDAQHVAAADREKILTVASLVEREAKLPVDRPLIAGVIYNRLAKNMKLELDSTVKFVAPSPGPFTTNADRATDSPYNTYMYTGLPPGPIAGPGAASIAAAVTPAQNDYLFFVTVNLDTGETAYAATLPEHLKNVQKMNAWIAAQPKATG